MPNPILQLTHVSKLFSVGESSIEILKDINLSIDAGSMVAIVGASGSGKSTLMNILGCLDHPSSGEYIVDGRNTKTLSADDLATLRNEYFGFVFQKYHLLSNLSALENVEIPAIYAGKSSADRQASSIELLGTLGLGDRINHRPNQLSGGQQQRVSIARALLNGGKVILADEPTGALDSASGQEMMQILHYLQDQGHTVIIVTHDMDVAKNAERIVEIHDGEIISDSPNVPDVALVTKLNNISSGFRIKYRSARTAVRKVKKSASKVSQYNHIFEAFKMARISLSTERLRTVLTMLGIIIGIGSVVSIMAIGEGQQQHVRDVIGPLTANKIEIRRGSGWGDSQAQGIHTLLPGDVELLKIQSYIASATPVTIVNMPVRFGNVSSSASVLGVGESFFDVIGITVSQGRSLRKEDIQTQAQVVVIDQEAQAKLFGPGVNPLGRVVIIGAVPCTVIGVTSEKSKGLLLGGGGNMHIPYSTAGVRFFGYQYFDSIMVRIKDGQNSELAEKNIITLLSNRHKLVDFFTNNKDTLSKAYTKTTKSISLALSLVASITLLVGGIGVMNILLVSVTERTREIGVRMAVGAKRSDIMTQFLIESVVICLIGGILGIFLSYLTGYLFSVFVSEWKMIFTTASIFWAFVFSTVIGMTFGFIPARKASLLSPYDALSQD